MTLILNLATKDFALQVADTLLTQLDGTKYDDQLVKSTIVHCRDAKLAVGYTGIGFIDNERTDKWLARELYSFKSWEESSSDCVAFLKRRLTAALPLNPNLGRHGPTVSLFGLGLDPAAKHRIVVSTVTNIENLTLGPPQEFVDVSPVGRLFEHYSFNPEFDGPWIITLHGANSPEYADITETFKRKMSKRLKYARNDKDAVELLDYMVSMLRMSKRDKKIGHLIGHDCTGVRIRGTFNSTAFFYSKNKRVLRFPNLVSKDGYKVDRVYQAINPSN